MLKIMIHTTWKRLSCHYMNTSMILLLETLFTMELHSRYTSIYIIYVCVCVYIYIYIYICFLMALKIFFLTGTYSKPVD